ncbi:MAG: DUF4338 domain-containing protein [Candidatus Schekmanbacteria bacterium]|nr:DUF4338 domain-containing protein [Candidatus Schekmanbacteria bacterium]
MSSHHSSRDEPAYLTPDGNCSPPPACVGQSMPIRDQWIEWSAPAGRANIRKVVCNSRFAIARGAHVPNLASHLLAKTPRRLPGDWQERYGYSPVLIETFIDCTTHVGTCYRAPSWIELGHSAGYEAPGAGGRRRTSPGPRRFGSPWSGCC